MSLILVLLKDDVAEVSADLFDIFIPTNEEGDKYPMLRCDPDDIFDRNGETFFRIRGIPAELLAQWCEFARMEGTVLDRRVKRHQFTSEQAKAALAKRKRK